MHAPGEQAKKLGKNETKTFEHTYWVKTSAIAKKVAQLFVITVAILEFLGVN